MSDSRAVPSICVFLAVGIVAFFIGFAYEKEFPTWVPVFADDEASTMTSETFHELSCDDSGVIVLHGKVPFVIKVKHTEGCPEQRIEIVGPGAVDFSGGENDTLAHREEEFYAKHFLYSSSESSGYDRGFIDMVLAGAEVPQCTSAANSMTRPARRLSRPHPSPAPARRLSHPHPSPTPAPGIYDHEQNCSKIEDCEGYNEMVENLKNQSDWYPSATLRQGTGQCSTSTEWALNKWGVAGTDSIYGQCRFTAVCKAETGHSDQKCYSKCVEKDPCGLKDGRAYQCRQPNVVHGNFNITDAVACLCRSGWTVDETHCGADENSPCTWKQDLLDDHFSELPTFTDFNWTTNCDKPTTCTPGVCAGKYLGGVAGLRDPPATTPPAKGTECNCLPACYDTNKGTNSTNDILGVITSDIGSNAKTSCIPLAQDLAGDYYNATNTKLKTARGNDAFYFDIFSAQLYQHYGVCHTPAPTGDYYIIINGEQHFEFGIAFGEAAALEDYLLPWFFSSRDNALRRSISWSGETESTVNVALIVAIIFALILMIVMWLQQPPRAKRIAGRSGSLLLAAFVSAAVPSVSIGLFAAKFILFWGHTDTFDRVSTADSDHAVLSFFYHCMSPFMMLIAVALMMREGKEARLVAYGIMIAVPPLLWWQSYSLISSFILIGVIVIPQSSPVNPSGNGKNNDDDRNGWQTTTVEEGGTRLRFDPLERRYLLHPVKIN